MLNPSPVSPNVTTTSNPPSPRCRAPRGLWSKPGVPHRGWTCEGVHREDFPQVCDMCESQEIYNVHTMTHPDYPETLEVGCVCAARMEGEYKA
jgi:hypothetical protein